MFDVMSSNPFDGPVLLPSPTLLTLLDKQREHEKSIREWDRWYLELAEFVSRKSKDPSTKCGAFLTRGREPICFGYNGFPRRVVDSPERYADRELKLKMVVHAEINAILFSKRDLTGCTLYTWPFQPCARCASLVIQSGIERVVAPVMPAEKEERWGEDMAVARQMFQEADVLLHLYDLDSEVSP